MNAKRSKRVWRRKERVARGPSGGAPAGLRERGTVLLMVIGVLALLAIIAVVYAAIGQADRRSSSAYSRSVQVEEFSSKVGDYVANIIGKGVFEAVAEQQPGTSGAPRRMRRTWDYHSITNNAHSRAGNGQIQFRPNGNGDQPWLASSEPTYLGTHTGNNWTDPQRPYLNYRDWLAISNVSPDGSFVNLANLRNNFFAEHGYGLDSSGNNKPQISRGMTLFGPNGDPFPGTGNVALDFPNGANADPDVPAHWTDRQRHAARPIDTFLTTGSPPGPAENAYYLNQWVDTDGDGIGDARWFELVDASVLAETTPKATGQGKARYFVGVRIVDLGGMVNLNTARDLAREPDLTNPAGLTPSDIDFRRALSLQDLYQRYGAANGYNGFAQPVGTPAPAWDYSGYTNAANGPIATAVGQAAYSSFIQSTLKGTVAPIENPATPVAGMPPAARSYNYRQFALNPGGASLGEVAPGGQARLVETSGATFGLGDELELRAFNGINDSRNRSRVEALLDGWSNKAPQIHPNFGPLRSNRPTELERNQRWFNNPPARGGQQDDKSLLAQAGDLRHRLTAVSSSRPLTSLVSPNSNIAAGVLSDQEVRVDLRKYISPVGGVLTDDEINELFGYMGDAMMPYRVGRWAYTTAANKTLQYGQRAEMAYRSMAHLMVNWFAALRDETSTAPGADNPVAISLKIQQGTTPVAPQYPYPVVGFTNNNDLAPSNMSESAAVNIYGIQAQPFIAGASSYRFWTDMPYDVTVIQPERQPDNEWADAHPGPPNPPNQTDGPVTIKNDTIITNADFLGEILAFQLTNPFDRDIVLCKADGKPLYYVEYAGHNFQLAEIDENTGEPNGQETKLKAGETRVFYATSPHKHTRFNERWLVANSSLHSVPNPPVPSDFIEQWVAHQFYTDPAPTGLGRPVHIMMLDDQWQRDKGITRFGDGGVPDRRLIDIQGEEVNNPNRKVVNLWKVVRIGTVDSDPAQPNVQANDLLVDRLRDPFQSTQGTLYQRLTSLGSDDIPGSKAGNDNVTGTPPFGGADRRDNTGFSITMWGELRRPTNPANPADRAPAGAMPPWCIETKADNDAAHPGVNGRPFLNKYFDGPNRGQVEDWRSEDGSRYKTLRRLINDQATTTGGTKLTEEMRKKAEDKTGNSVPDTQFPSEANANVKKKFAENAVRIQLAGRDAANTVHAPAFMSRLTDIYMPLAIGPWNDPNLANGAADRIDGLEKSWMTLSECLALAMDYYSPQDTGANDSPVYANAGHKDVNANIRPALDRGHLVLDDFAPYYDADGNGAFNPNPNGTGDRSLSLGIPLALNLLDKFRLDDYGGKGYAQGGQMNVNAASPLNLALLPMVCPDPLMKWMTVGAFNQPPSPQPSEYSNKLFDTDTQTYDIATTWAAYRDKLELPTRPRVTVSNIGQPDASALPVNNSQVLINFAEPLSGATAPLKRNQVTGIPGLREERGFRSIGEVVAVNLRDKLPTDPNYAAYVSNSMDVLAHDGRPITGHEGIDTSTIRVGTGAAAVEHNDDLIDDYSEKLAVASSVLNTITVRSDTFCVWFVVHGYLPTDVENLGPSDPMVPSIAKRYMMIVDRSNVIRDGDKPRILMFKEVPL